MFLKVTFQKTLTGKRQAFSFWDQIKTHNIRQCASSLLYAISIPEKPKAERDHTTKKRKCRCRYRSTSSPYILKATEQQRKKRETTVRCAHWSGEQASYWARAGTCVSTHKRKQQHLPYRSTDESGNAAKTGKHHETGGFTARRSGAQAWPSGKDPRTSGGWGGGARKNGEAVLPYLLLFPGGEENVGDAVL